MRSALIGHTGFVGGTLCDQRKFSHRYNSRDIESIQGKSFDEVFCAGMPAAKWIANQRPAEDLAVLERLKSYLASVEARQFTLISTVDVYASPVGVDESSEPDRTKAHPYGLHRLMLEEFVRERFPNHLIVRLPGLFGRGLKKNVIFDLMRQNEVGKIDPAAAYQYYDLKHLTADIEKARAAGLHLIHLTSEPIVTEVIAKRFFPHVHLVAKPAPSARYDFRTRHATLWGCDAHYQYSAEVVLQDLAQFLQETSPCV